MKAKEINALRDELARKQAVIEKMEDLHAKCMDGSCSCYSDVDGVCTRCNNSTRLRELAEKEIKSDQLEYEARQRGNQGATTHGKLIVSTVLLLAGLAMGNIGVYIDSIGLLVTAFSILVMGLSILVGYK